MLEPTLRPGLLVEEKQLKLVVGDLSFITIPKQDLFDTRVCAGINYTSDFFRAYPVEASYVSMGITVRIVSLTEGVVVDFDGSLLCVTYEGLRSIHYVNSSDSNTPKIASRLDGAVKPGLEIKPHCVIVRVGDLSMITVPLNTLVSSRAATFKEYFAANAHEAFYTSIGDSARIIDICSDFAIVEAKSRVYNVPYSVLKSIKCGSSDTQAKSEIVASRLSITEEYRLRKIKKIMSNKAPGIYTIFDDILVKLQDSSTFRIPKAECGNDASEFFKNNTVLVSYRDLHSTVDIQTHVHGIRVQNQMLLVGDAVAPKAIMLCNCFDLKVVGKEKPRSINIRAMMGNTLNNEVWRMGELDGIATKQNVTKGERWSMSDTWTPECDKLRLFIVQLEEDTSRYIIATYYKGVFYSVVEQPEHEGYKLSATYRWITFHG